MKNSKALSIAIKDLRECYESEGIIAGRHHFTDYWGRDAFFAAWGSLEIGDHDIVRKNTRLFFNNQREDGLMPYRIMRGPITIGKYLGKPKFYKKPNPTYRLRGILQDVFDGTTLCIIAYVSLIRKTKERNIYKEHIAKAQDYLEKKEKHGLLWDGIEAEWNDAAYKFGNILYSNILYWEMYDLLAAIAEKEEKSRLTKKRNKIGNALRERLWNGKYFADWHDCMRHDNFHSFGNLMSIAFGITNDEETESILKETEKHRLKFSFETHFPRYPFWRIDFLNQLAGLGDYQNGLIWWQPAAAYVAAMVRLKRFHRAREQIKLMEASIRRYGVHEVYERDGKPLKRLFYRSEHPFAWSSGMIVWAFSLAGKNDPF